MRVRLPGAMNSKGTLRSLVRLFSFTLSLRMIGSILNAAEPTWLSQPVEMAWLDPIISGLFVAYIAMTNPLKAHSDEPDAPPARPLLDSAETD